MRSLSSERGSNLCRVNEISDGDTSGRDMDQGISDAFACPEAARSGSISAWCHTKRPRAPLRITDLRPDVVRAVHLEGYTHRCWDPLLDLIEPLTERVNHLELGARPAQRTATKAQFALTLKLARPLLSSAL